MNPSLWMKPVSTEESRATWWRSLSPVDGVCGPGSSHAWSYYIPWTFQLYEPITTFLWLKNKKKTKKQALQMAITSKMEIIHNRPQNNSLKWEKRIQRSVITALNLLLIELSKSSSHYSATLLSSDFIFSHVLNLIP